MKLSQIIKVAHLEAKKAFDKGEVPVGAVVYNSEQIIFKSHNLIKTMNDHLSHAEILALKGAANKIGTNILNDFNLYVTLEPCFVCSYVISKYKIKNLYFGAYDTKKGSLENGSRIYNRDLGIYRPEVYGGLGEEKSEKMIKKFFKKIRKNY